MIHNASFRVLGQRDWEELARIRKTNPGPPALGAAAESLGLVSLAQQEFLMLERITSMRGR